MAGADGWCGVRDVTRELNLLKAWGRALDLPPCGEWTGEERAGCGVWVPTMRDLLIEKLLRIRPKTGGAIFHLNRAQREYSRRATKRNIVLKARQLGITTYLAARFFVETITRPGTVSVLVAHDREAAEDRKS